MPDPRRDGDVRIGGGVRAVAGDARRADRVVLVRHAATAWSGSALLRPERPAAADGGRREPQRVARSLAALLAPGTSGSCRARCAAPSEPPTRSPRAAGRTGVDVDDRWRETDFGDRRGPDVRRARAPMARTWRRDWPRARPTSTGPVARQPRALAARVAGGLARPYRTAAGTDGRRLPRRPAARRHGPRRARRGPSAPRAGAFVRLRRAPAVRDGLADVRGDRVLPSA